MFDLSKCIEKYVDKIIEKFKSKIILNFIKCFEVYGLNILISKITEEHIDYHNFLRLLSRYESENGDVDEVKNCIWNFLKEKSSTGRAGDRMVAIDALVESNYDFKSHFKEMLKTETNKNVRHTLITYLCPINPPIDNNNGRYDFPNLPIITAN